LLPADARLDVLVVAVVPREEEGMTTAAMAAMVVV
jgi:hypothetical protein